MFYPKGWFFSQGSLNGTHFGGIKKYKCMANLCKLEGFPFKIVHFVWVANIVIPVFQGDLVGFLGTGGFLGMDHPRKFLGVQVNPQPKRCEWKRAMKGAIT